MIELAREAFDRLSDALRDAGEDDAADEVDTLAERSVEAPEDLAPFTLMALAVLAEVMFAEPDED